MSKKPQTSKDDGEDSIISSLKRVSISVDSISLPPRRDEYRSSHREIGVALIFNHRELHGQESRKITNYQPIKNALKSFGFDVRTKNDLTFTKLNEQLQKVASEDHSDKDCLVVVVLSYGVEGSLLAKDLPYPVECLWEPFMGDKCPSLANKPKLFFIEACRGKEQYTAAGTSAITTVEIQQLAVPKTGDIFVFHGGFQHKFSSPLVGNGAVFIQSLSSVLEESATYSGEEGLELSSLRFAVIRKVSDRYESMCRKKRANAMRHMPSVISNLTKDFYLKVKRH